MKVIENIKEAFNFKKNKWLALSSVATVFSMVFFLALLPFTIIFLLWKLLSKYKWFKKIKEKSKGKYWGFVIASYIGIYIITALLSPANWINAYNQNTACIDEISYTGVANNSTVKDEEVKLDIEVIGEREKTFRDSNTLVTVNGNEANYNGWNNIFEYDATYPEGDNSLIIVAEDKDSQDCSKQVEVNFTVDLTEKREKEEEKQANEEEARIAEEKRKQEEEQERIREEKQQEENAYILKVSQSSERMSKAFGEMDLLQKKPLPILWTNTEVIELAAATLVIENEYDSFSKNEPPEKYQKYHELYLSSLKKHKEAMPILREGIDNLDVDKVNEAGAIMTEANNILTESRRELDRVKQNQ